METKEEMCGGDGKPHVMKGPKYRVQREGKRAWLCGKCFDKMIKNEQ